MKKSHTANLVGRVRTSSGALRQQFPSFRRLKRISFRGAPLRSTGWRRRPAGRRPFRRSATLQLAREQLQC